MMVQIQHVKNWGPWVTLALGLATGMVTIGKVSARQEEAAQKIVVLEQATAPIGRINARQDDVRTELVKLRESLEESKKDRAEIKIQLASLAAIARDTNEMSKKSLDLLIQHLMESGARPATSWMPPTTQPWLR